jgi:hypothetical protein
MLHLVLHLESELSIETTLGPIAALSKVCDSRSTQSSLLGDMSRHVLLLLEVSKSASKIWFGTESCGRNQFYKKGKN